jgi:hypothetical protein
LGLGILAWLSLAVSDASPPPASDAEALGRMVGRLALPIGLMLWGVVLIRRSRRP